MRYEVIKGRSQKYNKTMFAVVDTQGKEKPIVLHVKATAEQVAFLKNSAEVHILEPDGVNGVVIALIERDRMGHEHGEEKHKRNTEKTKTKP